MDSTSSKQTSSTHRASVRIVVDHEKNLFRLRAVRRFDCLCVKSDDLQYTLFRHADVSTEFTAHYSHGDRSHEVSVTYEDEHVPGSPFRLGPGTEDQLSDHLKHSENDDQRLDRLADDTDEKVSPRALTPSDVCDHRSLRVPRTQQAFGVHTLLHHMSNDMKSPDEVEVPLGNSIVRWNMNMRERVRTVPIHKSLVTDHRLSPCHNFHATVSDDGELAVHSADWSTEFGRAQCPTPPVNKVNWSRDSRRIVTVSKGEQDYLTAIVTSWRFAPETKSLTKVAEIQGHFPFAIFNAEGQIIVWQRKPCALALFDEHLVFQRKIQIPGEDFSEGFAITNDASKLACARRDHFIFVFNTSDLSILSQFKVADSADQLWTLLWVNDDELLMSLKSNRFGSFHASTGDQTGEFRGPDGFILALLWMKQSSRVGIASQSAVHALEFEPSGESVNSSFTLKSRTDISYHDITCCGVDFSSCSRYVACGDLSGQVIVWQSGNPAPVSRTSIPMSVRSLAWRRSFVVVGCLDGTVWQWTPNLEENVGGGHAAEPTLVCTLKGPVTVLEWENGDPSSKSSVLACGSSSGDLTCLKYSSDTNSFEEVLSFLAHPPVFYDDPKKREQFGSISRAADIWSLVWSPDNSFIATSSEDQSTIVWTRDGDKVTTLTGHTAAVTCADWVVTDLMSPQDGSPLTLIASCADDRTVLIRNADDNFSLFCTLESRGVYGWYTITYLRIQPGGHRIACGTENGYLIVWELSVAHSLGSDDSALSTKSGAVQTQKISHDHKAAVVGACRQLWCGRVHNGSIEGLEWSSITDEIVTCASDCTVMLHKFDFDAEVADDDESGGSSGGGVNAIQSSATASSAL